MALPLLAMSDRRLANGPRVIGLPTPGPSSVSVRVWYLVGSKHDPACSDGLVHRFEHRMCRRTKHLPDEAFDHLT